MTTATFIPAHPYWRFPSPWRSSSPRTLLRRGGRGRRARFRKKRHKATYVLVAQMLTPERYRKILEFLRNLPQTAA